jgi:hypothetical protein
MFGMIGSGNKNNQPAGKILTPENATFSVIEGHKKIDQGHEVITAGTWLEPSEEINLGNKNNSESMSDIGRLSAFAQASKKHKDVSGLIKEAVMEQTVDPSLLKSDNEAWKKGVETYLYNTDRTMEDVYPFSKKGEAKPEAEMDKWQKSMAEYRARWD